MKTDNATPRPWKSTPGGAIYSDFSDTKIICDCFRVKINAELIVRAVNVHEKLVSALELITQHAYDDDTPTIRICEDFDAMRTIAQKALDKAQG